MKELSIEEKAKRYDEALAMAKECITYIPDEAVNKYMLDMFPELKESDGERIRKQIISFLKEFEHDHYRSLDFSSWIAWLEKQNHDGKKWIYEDAYIKEREQLFQDGIDEVLENPQKYGLEKQGKQKTFDYKNANIRQKDFTSKSALEAINEEKVEPKFKVSKWYQCTKDFFGKGVTFDKNTAYYCAKEGCLQDEYGCHIAIVKDLYDNFKLWTIEDAKDGDALYFDDNTIVIFKDLYNSSTFHSYCHIEDGVFAISKDDMPDWWEGEGFQPATKEQRNLLFQKVKEAGYEWDEDKKELIKL